MFQPPECKICTSKLRKDVEDFILQGQSNYFIEKFLKKQGQNISHATVNRHKLKHMPEHIERIKEIAPKKRNQRFEGTDYDLIPAIDSLNQALRSKTSIGKYRKITLQVQEALKNQLTIVIRLQESFMRGELKKYPTEEMKGLQYINDILLKLEAYTASLPSIMPVKITGTKLKDSADQINEAITTGRISLEVGTKLFSIVSSFVKIVEVDDLSKRLEEIERFKAEQSQ